MADGVTYKVDIVYGMKGEATSGLKGLAKEAEATTMSLGGVKAALIAIGTGTVVHEATKAFIGFNREVQDAKISLAAMVQGNFGTNWQDSVDGANKLYGEFQKFSQLTPVTTQEMLEFGRGVTVATAQAGGSLKDIINVTEQGVVAAKALGAGGAYASLELTEMLQGNVSRRMRFAQQLLGMAHMDEKQFKALSAGDRLKTIEKVLNSDAMKNATEAFSKSFSGRLSTFEDKLQIGLGKIGLPIFNAVSEELARWNEWLDKNYAQIERIGHSIGEGLVAGFEAVKTAASFIFDHADVLIMAGKVWAAVKIGGLLSGAAGMLGGMGKFGVGGLTLGAGASSLGQSIAAGFRAAVLTTGIKFPGLIGPMNMVGKVASSMGSVLGALGPAGILGIGMAAHTLGEYLGVHKALTAAIDPVASKFEDLRKTMDDFDDSVKNFAVQFSSKFKGTSFDTGQSAGAAALIQDRAAKASALADLQAGRYPGANFSSNIPQEGVQRAFLKSRGFDPFETDRYFTQSGNLNSAYISSDIRNMNSMNSQLGIRQTVAGEATDYEIPMALKLMTKQDAESIDVAKGTQVIMMKQLQLLAEGKALLTPTEIAEILKNEARDKFHPKAADVKVDIHKIEVYSDDPDRFVAQAVQSFEEVVRNPTGAGDIIRGAF